LHAAVDGCDETQAALLASPLPRCAARLLLAPHATAQDDEAAVRGSA